MTKQIPVQAQQFVTLLLLLVAGKYLAYIYVDWLQIAVVLSAAVVIEHTLLYLQRKEIIFFSFSSLSTAIGILMMMVTPHTLFYIIILFLGLAQKHLLHYKTQHFFNPSNFALIAGMVLFYHDVHIVLGQLGDSIWLHLVLAMLGILVLYRVDRWMIPVSFMLFYLLFQYFWVVDYDPVVLFEDIYERFYSVSFVLFILFMLTDPRTTPSIPWQQICFGLLIAGMATGMDRWWGFRIQHLFMVLFILSPWVLLLQNWSDTEARASLLIRTGAVIVLALSAIIYLEMQPPYYFEMDG
jgi:Na+-translocating ferredoxin:NAD+ oxidoreductase RnfD subunit